MALTVKIGPFGVAMLALSDVVLKGAGVTDEAAATSRHG